MHISLFQLYPVAMAASFSATMESVSPGSLCVTVTWIAVSMTLQMKRIAVSDLKDSVYFQG